MTRESFRRQGRKGFTAPMPRLDIGGAKEYIRGLPQDEASWCDECAGMQDDPTGAECAKCGRAVMQGVRAHEVAYTKGQAL